MSMLSTHQILVSALTKFDERESRKKYYNRFAFGQYLMRLDEVEKDMEQGTSLKDALTAGFTGRLLDVLLRAVKEPVSTKDEQNRNLVYVPVSEQENNREPEEDITRPYGDTSAVSPLPFPSQ